MTHEIIIVTPRACKNVGAYLESSMCDLQMLPSSYFPNSYDFAPMFVGKAHRSQTCLGHLYTGYCRKKCMRTLFFKRVLTEKTQQTRNIFRACISDAFYRTLPSTSPSFLIISDLLNTGQDQNPFQSEKFNVTQQMLSPLTTCSEASLFPCTIVASQWQEGIYHP